MHEHRVGPASAPVSSQPEPFHVYKRHLPHWRNQGSTYFTTWRLHKRQSDLTPQERDIVFSALKFFDQKRFHLHACVVMNDHVHTLVEPCDSWALQSLVHTWKSFSANEIYRQGARKGALWQREYFDRLIRSEVEFREKRDYILRNPFKRWEAITEYKWMDGAGAEAGPTTVWHLDG
jgi:REP element-mobilizing transposase RayT